MSVFAAVVIIVYLLPEEYVATAKILVESQQIPDELARSTVTANASERVQIIEQRLMTRNNLLVIAREFNLYRKDTRQLSPSEIVFEMRNSAKIKQIADGSNRKNIQSIAFTIAFSYRNPVVSARVANRFVELILEQNIQTRKNRASETRRFFERQLQANRQALAGIETRIVDFKNKNSESLPDSLDRRREVLAELRSAMLEIDRKLVLLNEEKILWVARATESLNGTALDSNTDSTFTELEKLHSNLVQLKSLYSDEHPDIRKAKAQISALENAARLSLKKEEKSVVTNVAEVNLENDPSLDPKIASRLAVFERQKNNLEREKEALGKRAKVVLTTIIKTSSVEISLNALLREAENMQRQLRRAEDKMNIASIGETMEEGRQAERFEIIEQATVPDKPEKPDRPKLLVAGFFSAILVSSGFVAMLETLSENVRGASGLRNRLQITPISIIPYITTEFERRYRKRKIIIVITIMGAMVILGLIAVQLFYLPLDLVFEKAMNVLGLSRLLGM